MSLIDSLTRRAGQIADDVQGSLKRARVEGERRLLQRQHRAALEELGERAYALVRTGKLPEEPLASEIAAVESKLMEVEAKVAELDDMRQEPAPEVAAAGPERPETGEAPAPPADANGAGGPGPGWEAAERFFRRDA